MRVKKLCVTAADVVILGCDSNREEDRIERRSWDSYTQNSSVMSSSSPHTTESTVDAKDGSPAQIPNSDIILQPCHTTFCQHSEMLDCQQW